MEMEKEEQKNGQVVVEEQEQEDQEEVEEESTLLIRKSRTGIDNGISKNNGNAVEDSLVTQNGNGAKVDHGFQQKTKEVHQNGSEAEAETGDQKSESLVFYDNIQGDEYKTTYSEEEQIEKDTNHDKLDITSHDFNDQNSSMAIDNGVHLESTKEIESVEDRDTVNEDELEEEAEYDVEKVVQKQNTHDLFCPNCNSCITRRVILRKRKRRIRVSDDEVKRNKIEADVQESNDGVNFDYTPIPTADNVDDERKEEPDVFRCLSCFSFFIPNGKLFRKFGEKGMKENVREEQVANTKKNWFTSMFTSSTKQETTLEQVQVLCAGKDLATEQTASRMVN